MQGLGVPKTKKPTASCSMQHCAFAAGSACDPEQAVAGAYCGICLQMLNLLQCKATLKATAQRILPARLFPHLLLNASLPQLFVLPHLGFNHSIHLLAIAQVHPQALK
jgi:hypothetical protein